jgi:hypothetical protein
LRGSDVAGLEHLYAWTADQCKVPENRKSDTDHAECSGRKHAREVHGDKKPEKSASCIAREQ